MLIEFREKQEALAKRVQENHDESVSIRAIIASELINRT